MEWIIIGVSAAAFLIYILFYRYFGIDAWIQMFVLHSLVFAVEVALAILLWISIAEDYGTFAVTAAIAALAGFGTIILKYLLAEFVASRKN